jgi:CO/xanthine dehydrogenase FAD-binding subunit
VAQRAPEIDAVVDLASLKLAYVRTEGSGVRLGAMCTLQTLVSDPVPRNLAGGLLAEAARLAAPRPIRNVATLGGTLAVGGSTHEVLLALLVMRTQVTLRTPGRRTVSLDDFLGSRSALLSRNGLIEEVALPAVRPGAGGALAVVAPTPRDRPIVDAAALIVRRGGVVESARLAVGGVAAPPVCFPRVADSLVGRAPVEAVTRELARAVSDEVRPEGDWRGSAEYRREMAGVVAARAVASAWERAREA